MAIEPRQTEEMSNRNLSDEINLLELWHVLARWKALAGIVWLSIIIAMATYLAVAQKIFESRAVILVGKVAIPKENQELDGKMLLEEPGVLIARLSEKYAAGVVTDTYPTLASITVDKNGPENVVVISAYDVTPEGAQHYLAGVIDEIVQQHRELFTKWETLQLIRLESVRQRIVLKERQVDNLSILGKTRSAVDTLEESLLLFNTARLTDEKMHLENIASTIELRMSKPQSYPTEVIQKPTIGDRPVEPRYKMLLLLAIFGGLVASIFLVFILDMLSSIRK